MRLLMGLLVFSVAAIAAFPAWAQDDQKISGPLAQKYKKRKAEIALVDKNKDGMMQLSEYMKGWDRRFKAADTDGDLVLSRKEIKAYAPIYAGQRANVYGKLNARHVESKFEKQMTAKIDYNRDKKVEPAELIKYLEKRFKKMDRRNKDGNLTYKEFRTFTVPAKNPNRKKKKESETSVQYCPRCDAPGELIAPPPAQLDGDAIIGLVKDGIKLLAF